MTRSAVLLLGLLMFSLVLADSDTPGENATPEEIAKEMMDHASMGSKRGITMPTYKRRGIRADNPDMELLKNAGMN